MGLSIKWRMILLFQKIFPRNVSYWDGTEEELDDYINELFNPDIIQFPIQELGPEYIEPELHWIYSFPDGLPYLEGSPLDQIRCDINEKNYGK